MKKEGIFFKVTKTNIEKNNLTKLFLLMLIFALCIFTYGCSLGGEKDETTINVCNWGEYISNGAEGSIDVNSEFTK